jgi:hypothetical protein
VSTRVVSWKEAAARKLSVRREERVTEKHGFGCGGLAAFRQHLGILGLKVEEVYGLARYVLGVSGGVHLNSAEHLAHHNFNVLVVD